MLMSANRCKEYVRLFFCQWWSGGGGCFQWERREKRSSRRRWRVSFSCVAAHLKVGNDANYKISEITLTKQCLHLRFPPGDCLIFCWRKKKWKLLIYLKSCSLPEPVLFRWSKVKILEDRLTDWALVPWLIEYFIWIRSTKNQYDSRERKKIHVYVCAGSNLSIAGLDGLDENSLLGVNLWWALLRLRTGLYKRHCRTTS